MTSLSVQIFDQRTSQSLIVGFPVRPNVVLQGFAWRPGVVSPDPENLDFDAIACAINEGPFRMGMVQDESDLRTGAVWRILNPEALPDTEWREPAEDDVPEGWAWDAPETCPVVTCGDDNEDEEALNEHGFPFIPDGVERVQLDGNSPNALIALQIAMEALQRTIETDGLSTVRRDVLRGAMSTLQAIALQRGFDAMESTADRLTDVIDEVVFG